MKIKSLQSIKFPDEFIDNRADLKKGFIVQVYQGVCSILVNNLQIGDDKEPIRAGFFGFYYAPGNFNTASKNIERVIERCFERQEDKIELFYFDSLIKFARAILDNGWTIEPEND